MIDNRNEFNLIINQNFLEVLFLEKNRVYFHVIANENVLYNPLQYIYQEDSAVLFSTLNEIIEKMERKSEKCEILGYDAYYSALEYEIQSLPNWINWTFPIHLHNNIINISISIKYLEAHNIYLGYYSLNTDGDKAFLFANSYKDSLTGLFNRNTLNLHLSKLNNDEQIYGVMMDLDHFKYINDTYGHAKGNELLSHIGNMFIEMADERIIFYRVGGDEFFMQIHANHEQVIAILREIQLKIQSIRIGEQSISCSMGAVPFNVSYGNTDNFLKECDKAMYKAKSAGRNQFYII